jgi:hypothetical protein
MSTMLGRVDWPRFAGCVLRRLAGDADELLRAESARLEGSPVAKLRPHAVVLALAVDVAPYRHTAAALGECAPALSFGDQLLVLAWLQSAARQLIGRSARPTAAAEHATPAVPGALDIEGVPLTTMPRWLLDLAGDIARDRGLSIALDVDQPRAGCYYPATRTIFLDPSNGAHGPVEWVLAHELGHVLDPQLGRRPLGIDDETFADAFARLAVECKPRTRAEALPMVESAQAQLPADDPNLGGALPTDPIEQVLALLALPITKGTS